MIFQYIQSLSRHLSTYRTPCIIIIDSQPYLYNCYTCYRTYLVLNLVFTLLQNYRETSVIGQRKGFSQKDIIKINSFYNCSTVSRTPKMFPVGDARPNYNKSVEDSHFQSEYSPNSAVFSKSSHLCFIIIVGVIMYLYKYTISVQYTLYSMNVFLSECV